MTPLTPSPQAPLLEAHGVTLTTPSGRTLLRDLNASVGREQVALIGRNGVGKSSLLDVLAGLEAPRHGSVVCEASRLLVRQRLDPSRSARQLLRDVARTLPKAELESALGEAGLRPWDELSRSSGLSRGEQRKLLLLEARARAPELLLLDEPTQDLDAVGVAWLVAWLRRWTRGVIVASHDRRLLQHLRQFFVIAEAGAYAFAGTLEELDGEHEARHQRSQRSYLAKLNRLVEREQHNERVTRRRRRKKNLGRLHEERRCSARAQLMGKKGYAQASQGKAARIRQARIGEIREWTHAARRALTVALPLELGVPVLGPEPDRPAIALDDVSVRVGGREILSHVTLSVGRQRVGVLGPNGAGKSTLLEVMARERKPTRGSARCQTSRIGYIAQGGSNWLSSDTLAQRLEALASTQETIAGLLVAHRFPLALAHRPLDSLSPGERLRAALICLFRAAPRVDVLVLDEPTHGVDFVGARALTSALCAWPGGLVVASHEPELLDAIRLDQRITLPGGER